jgi:peroxiredoxin Q/BCP
MLQEKDLAPDFELLADTAQPVRLSDFTGQKVLLYFYSKAMTSG